jgi:hypothetical protein
VALWIVTLKTPFTDCGTPGEPAARRSSSLLHPIPLIATTPPNAANDTTSCLFMYTTSTETRAQVRAAPGENCGSLSRLPDDGSDYSPPSKLSIAIGRRARSSSTSEEVDMRTNPASIADGESRIALRMSRRVHLTASEYVRHS